MQKRSKTPEEVLFEKEGRGRFNLRQTSTISKLKDQTRGPKFVIRNRRKG